MPILSGGGGGFLPVLGIVRLSAALTPWDGSAITFDQTLTDAAGLWHAASHQFVALTAGWYRASLWANQTALGITTNGVAGMTAQLENSGAGDNIRQGNFVVYGGSSSALVVPVTGITHLAVGDAVFVSGASADVLTVDRGTTFSLELVRAG